MQTAMQLLHADDVAEDISHQLPEFETENWKKCFGPVMNKKNALINNNKYSFVFYFDVFVLRLNYQIWLHLDNNCAGKRKYGLVVCSLSTPKKFCVNSCGSGYFLQPGNQTCQECSRKCLNCSGNAENCTTCYFPTFLSFSSCVKDCPDGQFGNLGNGRCEPCYAKCKTCLNGWSNKRCLSCRKPYFLSKFTWSLILCHCYVLFSVRPAFSLHITAFYVNSIKLMPEYF